MIGDDGEYKPTLDRMICVCGWIGFYFDLEDENICQCPMCQSKDIKYEDPNQQND